MATRKPRAKKAQVITLADIAAGGVDGIFVSEDVYTPFLEQGLVEINDSMRDENGNTATRVTQKGIEMLDNSEKSEDTANTEVNEPNQQPVIQEANKMTFQIEDSIPVPAITGRGRTGNAYPFDKLEVGQSFFVPNSHEKPNAAKSMASTVASATARYAVVAEDGATKTNKKGKTVPVMVPTRKFVVRSVEGGARIWRTV